MPLFRALAKNMAPMTNADESPTNRLTLFWLNISLFIVSTLWHGRQPEVNRVVIDGEWWRQPFSFEIEITNVKAEWLPLLISNENGWRHHSPSITARFTSGWRPCWQKRLNANKHAKFAKTSSYVSSWRLTRQARIQAVANVAQATVKFFPP